MIKPPNIETIPQLSLKKSTVEISELYTLKTFHSVEGRFDL